MGLLFYLGCKRGTDIWEMPIIIMPTKIASFTHHSLLPDCLVQTGRSSLFKRQEAVISRRYWNPKPYTLSGWVVGFLFCRGIRFGVSSWGI